MESSANREADTKSRRLRTETEWCLAEYAFPSISVKFGFSEIDFLAIQTNTKCKKFVSWKWDPEAVAIDTFTIS